MNKGNAGLLALCVLLGGIAFGVLFVAPRYLTADEESSVAAGKAVVTENAGETNADESEADDKQERVAAAGDAEPVEQAADEPAEQASDSLADDEPYDDLAALVDEGIGLSTDGEAGQQSADASLDADGQEADEKPAFDLLRVEPDGSTVIAGRAEPGKRLEVMNGDKVIATTDVGPSGDFAAVFDEPLEPGDYQLTLRTTGGGEPNSVSDEVATISIPSGDSGELLAMVTEPGEASRLVARPEADVKDATATGDAETKEAGDAEEDAGADTDGAALAGEGDADAEPDAVDDASAAGPERDDDRADRAMTASNDAAEDETAGAAADPMADALRQSGAGPEEEPAEEQRDVATLEPTEREDHPSPDAPAPVVRIDAVEVEGDALFVAGAARSGSTVRVYANDRMLGDDAVGAEGRFLVEGRLPLAVGGHQIRADLIRQGEVVARALVPFERPSGEVAAAVAAPAGEESEAGEELAATRGDAPPETEEPTQPLEQGSADPEPVAPPEEILAAERLDDDIDPVEPASEPSAEEPATELAVTDQAAVAAPAPRTGTTATENELPATENEPVAIDRETKAAETETVVAATGDEPVTLQQEALTPTDASVIIRRGDTLWQISRRVYGQGVRYTTIYLANQDQIVDPDRILPGQIFDVPEEALENAEDVHRRLQAD